MYPYMQINLMFYRSLIVRGLRLALMENPFPRNTLPADTFCVSLTITGASPSGKPPKYYLATIVLFARHSGSRNSERFLSQPSTFHGAAPGGHRGAPWPARCDPGTLQAHHPYVCSQLAAATHAALASR